MGIFWLIQDFHLRASHHPGNVDSNSLETSFKLLALKAGEYSARKSWMPLDYQIRATPTIKSMVDNQVASGTDQLFEFFDSSRCADLSIDDAQELTKNYYSI